MLAALNGHVEAALYRCPFGPCGRLKSAQVLRLLVARRAKLEARANDGLTPLGALAAARAS